MAELVDARDLKSLELTLVRVQVPLWVPKKLRVSEQSSQIVRKPFFCAQRHFEP